MVEAPPSSANISVRIVPGAPPPAPLTELQLKKKRKLKTAKARTTADESIDSLTPRKDSGSPENVPNASSQGNSEGGKKATEAGPEPELALHPSTIALEGQKPPSPIADRLINKRIKAPGKKNCMFPWSDLVSFWFTFETYLATHRSLLVKTRDNIE